MELMPLGPFFYNEVFLTLDMVSKKELLLADIIVSKKLNELAGFIRDYAVKEQVDNVWRTIRVENDFSYYKTHLQENMQYLDELDERFYLSPDSLHVFLKVRDNNINYLSKSGQLETLGELFMEVPVPLRDIERSFINETYYRKLFKTPAAGLKEQ